MRLRFILSVWQSLPLWERCRVYEAEEVFMRNPVSKEYIKIYNIEFKPLQSLWDSFPKGEAFYFIIT